MGWHMERALDTHHCSVDPKLLYFSMTMFGTQISATREGITKVLGGVEQGGEVGGRQGCPATSIMISRAYYSHAMPST